MAGIFAVLETADLEGGETTDLDIVQGDVEVADVTNDIVEATQEVEGGVEVVNNTIQDTEELNEIGEVAADAVESGEGLDEKSAEIATIAIERAYLRLGMSSSAIAEKKPSLEAFSNPNTRLAQTKWIKESIGDVVKKAWESIVAMAKRIWEAVKRVIAGLFKNVGMLEKQLKAQIEKAGKLDGKEGGATMSSSALATALSVDGKANADSYKKLAASAQAAIAAAPKLTEERNAMVQKIMGTLEKAADEYTKLREGNETFSGGSTVRVLTAIGESNAKLKKELGATDKAFGPFVGNRSFVVRVDGETKSFSMGFEANAEGAKKEEVAVLSPDEMKAVGNEALGVLTALAGLKKVESAMTAVNSAVGSLAKTIASKVGKFEADEAKKKTLGEMKKDVAGMLSSLSVIGSAIPSIAWQTASLGSKYISISMSKYRTAGGAAPAGEPAAA